MQKTNDKIQFESRREIEAIMDAIAKLVEKCPEEKSNDDLRRLYDLLDVMHMSW